MDDTRQAPPWIDSLFSLRFGLGDKTLFHKRVPALTLAHDPLASKEDDWERHVEALARRDRVLVVRSYPVSRPLPTLERRAGLTRYVTEHFQRYFVRLDGSYEAYLSAFSAKTRSTLKRKVRKFIELDGGGRMEVYRTGEQIDRFWTLARQVSAKTYQEKLLGAGLPDGAEALARAKEKADRDACRGYLLFVGDAPVAFIYLEGERGTLEYRYLGFDPAYADHSAGTVLHWLMLESLFGEGRFAVLDFTEGEGTQKKTFGTDSRFCANILYYPDTPSFRLWFTAHLGMDRLSGAIGRALDRLGLKAAVRRWLRGQQ